MRTPLQPENFTKTLASYSHGMAVDVGDCEMIFTTGQLAMDSEGNAVAPTDIEKQTEYVFENLKKILAEAGATLGDIVKVTIFVTHIEDYPKISAIRNRYLAESKPTSTLVEIIRTVKPGCDIEIEAIAIRKK